MVGPDELEYRPATTQRYTDPHIPAAFSPPSATRRRQTVSGGRPGRRVDEDPAERDGERTPAVAERHGPADGAATLAPAAPTGGQGKGPPGCPQARSCPHAARLGPAPLEHRQLHRGPARGQS